MGAPVIRPVVEAEPDGGLATAIVAFRWLAWVWMAVVVLVERDRLVTVEVAVALVAAALAVTFAGTVLRATSGRLSLHPLMVGVELAVGMSLLVGDGWVYDGDQRQSLGSAWPLAGPIAAGVGYGPRVGVAAGVALGAARVVTGLVGSHVATVSVLSSAFLYALGGGLGGWIARRLRAESDLRDRLAAAEVSLATRREREEMGRTLHDGVLQTLAVVQRRSTDAELSELARDQERELRHFLFGSTTAAVDLASALRDAAATHERVYGGRVEVIVVDQPELSDQVVAAIVGAAREAMTNAAKHGEATRVTVFAEGDGDGIFCSVNDDGSGFDPTQVAPGVGIARSIQGRIGEVGGRVEIVSASPRGTEVRMWVP